MKYNYIYTPTASECLFSRVGETLRGSIWEQNRNLTPRNRLIGTGGPLAPSSSFLMQARLALVNTGPAGSEVAKWLPGQKLLEVLAGASWNLFRAFFHTPFLKSTPFDHQTAVIEFPSYPAGSSSGRWYICCYTGLRVPLPSTALCRASLAPAETRKRKSPCQPWYLQGFVFWS